jgi:hypothetical protein
MNKRRLLKLADLLEADAKNKNGIKFDLSLVVASARAPLERWIPAVDCGTKACAIGLWGLSGKFKGVSYGADGWPRYERSVGLGAAMKYFQLERHESEWLFLDWEYPSNSPKTGAAGERAVAKRIRDFVAGKIKP